MLCVAIAVCLCVRRVQLCYVWLLVFLCVCILCSIVMCGYSGLFACTACAVMLCVAILVSLGVLFVQ